MWKFLHPSDAYNNVSERFRVQLHTHNTMRGYKYGSHHGKRAERRRNHVAHHIPVIVLACPDISAFRLHNAGNRIVDQGIEINDACRFELLIIFRIIDFLENVLERMVILLGDCVFCRKPQNPASYPGID